MTNAPRWESPAEARAAKRLAAIDSGLRKFLGTGPTAGLVYGMLYTDSRRPTVGWRGITDEEVRALSGRKLATIGPVQQDGRQPIALTEEGKLARDLLRFQGSAP